MRFRFLFVLSLFFSAALMGQEKRDTIRSVDSRKNVSIRNQTNNADSVSTNRKGMASRQKEIMDQLDLSREQQKKLRASNSSLRDSLKVLKGNSDLSKQERRKQLSELMKKREESLRTILSAEQYKKYKELNKNNKEFSPLND